jgi:uncharacterized membrane protein
MIQRIQTLFLLAALALISSHLYSVLVKVGESTIKYVQNSKFLILSATISLILFLTIFLYRRRILQIRLSVFGLVLMVAYQIWLGYLYFTAPAGSLFSVTIIFPIIAAILTLTAIRYIARDEALVRSVNSLRKTTSGKKRR